MNVGFGDLTGDGKDEAVIKLGWSFARYGGRGYGFWVDVYTVKNNKLSLLTQLEGGGLADDYTLKNAELKN